VGGKGGLQELKEGGFGVDLVSSSMPRHFPTAAREQKGIASGKAAKKRRGGGTKRRIHMWTEESAQIQHQKRGAVS